MSAAVLRLALLLTAVGLFGFTGIAAAASTDPQVALVPADAAWAGSIVLTPADLGTGWTAQPDNGGSGSDDSAFCPEGTIDYSGLTVTGGGVSPEFTRGESSDVSSYALVWKTADQGRAAWDRTNATMTAINDCLASLFTSLSTKELEVVVTANGAMPLLAVAPRTAAYRIKLLFKTTKRVKGKLKKISSPASLDTVVLGNGRATAVIFLDAFDRKPFKPGYEQALAAAMAARMASDPAATP